MVGVFGWPEDNGTGGQRSEVMLAAAQIAPAFRRFSAHHRQHPRAGVRHDAVRYYLARIIQTSGRRKGSAHFVSPPNQRRSGSTRARHCGRGRPRANLVNTSPFSSCHRARNAPLRPSALWTRREAVGRLVCVCVCLSLSPSVCDAQTLVAPAAIPITP